MQHGDMATGIYAASICCDTATQKPGNEGIESLPTNRFNQKLDDDTNVPPFSSFQAEKGQPSKGQVTDEPPPTTASVHDLTTDDSTLGATSFNTNNKEERTLMESNLDQCLVLLRNVLQEDLEQGENPYSEAMSLKAETEAHSGGSQTALFRDKDITFELVQTDDTRPPHHPPECSSADLKDESQTSVSDLDEDERDAKKGSNCIAKLESQLCPGSFYPQRLLSSENNQDNELTYWPSIESMVLKNKSQETFGRRFSIDNEFQCQQHRQLDEASMPSEQGIFSSTPTFGCGRLQNVDSDQLSHQSNHTLGTADAQDHGRSFEISMNSVSENESFIQSRQSSLVDPPTLDTVTWQTFGTRNHSFYAEDDSLPNLGNTDSSCDFPSARHGSCSESLESRFEPDLDNACPTLSAETKVSLSMSPTSVLEIQDQTPKARTEIERPGRFTRSIRYSAPLTPSRDAGFAPYSNYAAYKVVDVPIIKRKGSMEKMTKQNRKEKLERFFGENVPEEHFELGPPYSRKTVARHTYSPFNEGGVEKTNLKETITAKQCRGSEKWSKRTNGHLRIDTWHSPIDPSKVRLADLCESASSAICLSSRGIPSDQDMISSAASSLVSVHSSPDKSNTPSSSPPSSGNISTRPNQVIFTMVNAAGFYIAASNAKGLGPGVRWVPLGREHDSWALYHDGNQITLLRDTVSPCKNRMAFSNPNSPSTCRGLQRKKTLTNLSKLWSKSRASP